MEARDPAELMRLFKQALDRIHGGDLRASDLQLPIYATPPCYKQTLPGYEGGAFDPERLGAACIVVPPSQGRGENNQGVYNLNAVPPRPSPPDHPPKPQTLSFKP